MDFELTDEQRLLQDTVRQFVEDRILPNAVENDIVHHLDMDAINGMAELGILGITIPEEYGGAGLDFVSEALACEEIERGEAAFRTLISVHVGLNSLALLRYASEEQKQRWLVPQARGEKIACFGLTEPAAGSDVAAMRTSARREGETFGQPIGQYQFVQDMIAKMVLGYETSKLLVIQAAWMKDEGRRNTRETSLAKWHATESAFEAAHLAIQVFGAYGYSAEYGIERYFRNARAPLIYEGTTQIHKMMQAEHALGFRRLNGHTGEMAPLVSWRAPGAAEPVKA